MLTAHSKKLPFADIENSNLFEFSNKDYTLVLAGYPVLRAFTVSSGSDIWVEVYLQIDITRRIIFFSQIDKKQNKKLKALKWEESLLEELFKETPDIYIKNMEEFFNTIPADISLVVMKYPDSHWQLTKAINFIGKDILSVMSTNPTLAYVIINMEKINSSFISYNEIELLKKMIRTKQKKILSLCGFPGTDRVVKIFSKIDPRIISIKDIVRFRNLLIMKSKTAERALKILSFAKIIDKNLFNLILFHTPLINLIPNKVIYELVSSKLFIENKAKLKRIYLESNRLKIKIPEIKSLGSLNKVYEKLLKTVEIKRRNKKTFPTPPIEDNYCISAICDKKGLNSWSKK